MTIRTSAVLAVLLLSAFVLLVGCDKEDTIVLPDNYGGSAPALVVEPGTLLVEDDGESRTIYFATFPAGNVTWQVAAAPEWVHLNPSSGTVGATISEVSVSCDAPGMNPGMYQGRIELISTGGSADVEIMFNVGVHPILAVEDTLISLDATSDEGVMTLMNTGTGTVEWSLTESADWLSPSYTEGYIYPGQSRQVLLNVDRTGIAPGTYSTMIDVVSNSEEGDLAVRVEMEVAARAILDVTASDLIFGYFEDTAELVVGNNGNIALAWTAAVDQPFLRLDVESGSVEPGETAMITVEVDRAGFSTGVYEANFVVTGPDDQEVTIPVVVRHFESELTTLDFRVSDAEYDRNYDVIVASANGPDQLVILDPETGTDTRVDLALPGSCVSIGPDGTQAAVGHNGYISLVDLTTGTLSDTYAVTTEAVDIVLAGNGFCYVFPRQDQWESIRCIELATGVETTSGGFSIRAGTLAKLHPSGDYIYGADNGLSPSDFEKYDIRGGTATMMYDSPYHGNYAFSGNIWISDDGLRLFARSGNVFRSSTLQADDMTYNGNLVGTNYIKWIDHSSAAGLILVINGASYNQPEPGGFSVFETEFLAFKGNRSIPQFLVPDGQGSGDLYDAVGNFIFMDQAGARFHVLVKADADSGLLNDWALYSGNTADLTP